MRTKYGSFFAKYFPKCDENLIKYWDWASVFSAMSARPKCQNLLKSGVFS